VTLDLPGARQAGRECQPSELAKAEPSVYPAESRWRAIFVGLPETAYTQWVVRIEPACVRIVPLPPTGARRPAHLRPPYRTRVNAPGARRGPALQSRLDGGPFASVSRGAYVERKYQNGLPGRVVGASSVRRCGRRPRGRTPFPQHGRVSPGHLRGAANRHDDGLARRPAAHGRRSDPARRRPPGRGTGTLRTPLQETEPLHAPAACPFCRSPRIATSAAKVDASSYWRCEACGQMWNADRLRSSAPRGFAGRYDR